MTTHSKWLGGQLVFYDSTEPQRIIAAIGPDMVEYREEFVKLPFIAADSPGGWTTTLVEAGDGQSTVALEQGAAGGVLLISVDENDNDGVTMQAEGEAFKLASGKECYFGIKFKMSEVTQSDFMVGLIIKDAENALLGGVTDGVYWRKIDGSTTMNFVLEKDAAETETAYGSALVDDTWYTLEFYFDGTTVDWYVNGAQQTAPAVTNLPDDEFLTPSMEFLNGAEGGTLAARVDWIRVFQSNE